MGTKAIDVTRSIIIDAPAAAIYENTIDISKWEEWGDWHQQDPNMIVKYSENTKGLGAKSSWESESLGNGSQTIIEVSPNKMIKTQLKFDDWEGFSYANIIFNEVNPNQTKVSWTLNGDRDIPFLMRGFMVIADFEGAIEKDYDSGLASLKQLMEEQMKEQAFINN
jgi:hypothetical protein